MKENVLDTKQLAAMETFKAKVSQIYEIASVTLFGSTARKEAEANSDLDVLVVTKKQLAHRERHAIYRIATEINWELDTNISATIVDEYNWEHGLYSIMLIKEEVSKDGVII